MEEGEVEEVKLMFARILDSKMDLGDDDNLIGLAEGTLFWGDEEEDSDT